jgi:hypothetical protein
LHRYSWNTDIFMWKKTCISLSVTTTLLHSVMSQYQLHHSRQYRGESTNGKQIPIWNVLLCLPKIRNSM